MELQALSRRQGNWKLQLGDDAAHLEALAGGERITVERASTAGRLELHDLWAGKGALVLPKAEGRKKLQFQLTPEQRQEIDRWIGPRTPAHLAVALRQRYAWAIPFGVLLVLVSLPLPAEPEAGLEAVPGSPFTALLGAALVGMWLVARFWPTPRLLLFDAVWLVLLLLSLAADVVTGRSSPWWLLWGLLLLILLRSGLSMYKRFKHLAGG